MRMICAVLPLLALAGCSSFRADPNQVTQVPSDRLLAYQQPVEGGGQIVVNRDMGGLGAGCYIAVLIDRQVAARIGIGEEASFQVPAGNRIVGIGVDEQDDTLCSKGRLRRELALPLAAGESRHFRIVSENRNGFAIQRDDQ
ncbi:3-isopropylmalate dehydratase [Metapseudomonas boanensis]|uniref:3-isopropylmalate dehydratase n=1 Tax=Metapseudomonas boanensis TaxID=2822138 RepID=A0ABS5XLP3_9GAMM|nr:3-isopropylmalate dehydratase [Pseudomonas boanensis]MBT8768051.1 3-isopropylmalate dehydratase [Pseudomonas boanensis]